MPQTKQELFNLRHAKLRNVVERVFGVFKNRFRIFLNGRDGFSLKTQDKLIIACSALHNWINEYGDKPRREWTKMKRKRGGMARRRYETILKQQEKARVNAVPDPELVYLSQKEGTRYIYAKRDSISDEMWSQYQSYLEARGIEEGESEWGSSDEESNVSDGTEESVSSGSEGGSE
ncbi:hypothetical protein GcM1_211064 [Golovinomyces cichoracearum]|uniref:DDE Tnp4 domain-containing protein n=1 Tax=Golovinomyces cichoracearum TaxID=62708 RepID=A0A420IVC2_9PEZI|nr:hypothetical protein GcM1_211064 [Golovinomyces cichoracearum]